MWEVMAFRSEWIEAFGAVDEIWTPSTFVTEAIQTAAPLGLPVRTIPHVVEARIFRHDFRRLDFGIPEDAFVFLSVFDASSAFERKNPGGIDAFAEAFSGVPNGIPGHEVSFERMEGAKIAEMRRAYAAPNWLSSTTSCRLKN